MTLYQELRDAVKDMRAAQQKFFKDRKPENLIAAREQEARVDKLISDQGNLFANGDQEGGGDATRT